MYLHTLMIFFLISNFPFYISCHVFYFMLPYQKQSCFHGKVFTQVLLHLYLSGCNMSLVHPLMKHALQAWTPYTKGNTDKLEGTKEDSKISPIPKGPPI